MWLKQLVIWVMKIARKNQETSPTKRLCIEWFFSLFLEAHKFQKTNHLNSGPGWKQNDHKSHPYPIYIYHKNRTHVGIYIYMPYMNGMGIDKKWHHGSEKNTSRHFKCDDPLANTGVSKLRALEEVHIASS